MEFVSIDVETANADMASICQVGTAHSRNGSIEDEWGCLINPQTHFDAINVGVHGIDERAVAAAPTITEIADLLHQKLAGKIVVCHTHFDRVALHRAAKHYNFSLPEITWLDSAKVARRAWEEFASKGYGLANVCKHIGYQFKHHDAQEDAKAAAAIMHAACLKTGISINEWLIKTDEPITPPANLIEHDANPNGPLFGEVIVFTGALELPRREASEMAAQMGCVVGDKVTKRTTILVVGDQDISR